MQRKQGHFLFLDIDLPAFSQKFLSLHWCLLVPICSSLFCGVSVAMVSAGASGDPKVDKKEQGVEGNVLEKPVSI